VGGSENFGASTTTPGTVGSGSEASEATTKGAGARALSGNDANADTTSSVTAATDSSTSSAAGTTGNLSRQDSTFVREAAQSGLAEVQMGKLVQQNAQSQQLKDFGQRLVSDHTQANNELMQIAQQKGITAPTTISAHDQHMMSKLSGLNGAEFDRMCQQDAVAAHEKAVKLFQTEAQSGQDPELKAFAQKTLPTLQEHLRMAKQMSGSSSTSSRSGSTDSSNSQ
jgi:putative membrane protein